MNAAILTVLVHLAATFQGTVRAEGTREPIAHTRVEIAQLGRAAFADADGYFIMADVPQGRWLVEASALGYDTVRISVVSTGRGALRVDFELPRRPVQLGAVAVESEAMRTRSSVSPDAGAGPPPARLAGPGQLKYLPGLAEPDVLRALQQLPSVAAISDFSNGLYVRGGAADQNLIMLDGVPLFNPYHLGGIFSAINADAVAGVEVWSGALPAREGDRLSSAVRIDTRDGGRDRMRASGAVGLVSSNATVDGPLGGRGSYLVSARRTYVDAATGGLYAVGLIDQIVPYGFWDVLLKGTHDLGELGRLTFSGYLNREGVSVPPRMREAMGANAQLRWGSRMAALALRQPIGAQMMWNSRLAVTDFTGDFDLWDWRTDVVCGDDRCEEIDTDTTHSVTGTTSARDIIAESELAWYGRAHTIRIGARSDGYSFHHNLAVENQDRRLPSFRSARQRTTVAAFLEDEWRISDRLQVRGGMRLLHAGDLGTEWLPRAGARLALSSTLVLTAGAGRYAQAVRSMRTDESAVSSIISYDVLTTQPLEAGLARGSDIVAGVHIDRGATSLRVDAYAKKMRGLVLPELLTDPVSLSPLVIDTFLVGTATARGIELYARHMVGRVELSGSYTHSRTLHSAGGETYVPRFERRHVLDITALLPWGSRGLISGRAAFATGQPFTPVIGRSPAYRFNPVTGEFEDAGVGTLIMGEYNSERLPPYFRLDVAARREYDRRWFGRPMQVTPYAQILNVLNMRNVMLSEPQPYEPSYQHWPQLPILPTFGVEWRF
jgi:hypothetical protein